MSQGSLILSGKDVRAVLTMEDDVVTQEEVFALNARGKAWCGDTAWVHPDSKTQTYPAEGKMMTGGIEPDWWGVKNIFYGEYDPEGRRRVSVLTIFDTKTLCPVAVMECLYIGNVRTGAGGAVATKYLARKDARVIGILGSGAVAWFTLLAHRAMEWPASKVQVYSRSEERRQKFAQDMSSRTGYQVVPVESAEKVVREAEILITGAATLEPILKADWVQPGTHVNAMGQKHEIDLQLYTRAKNVGDEAMTAIRDGKLSVAIKAGVITEEAVHAGLGEVVEGMKPGRTSEDEITLFDSSGLCVQDIATGVEVWKKAQEQGIGRRVEFHHTENLR
jgi:alanine dehydrogenase